MYSFFYYFYPPENIRRPAGEATLKSTSVEKMVVLSGAGMSAESGIRTFRDSDGLWEEYRVEDVCTPEAWRRDPVLVNRFYNERRRQLLSCQPNAGHVGLARLEEAFEVYIITQNVDNLHERAGSSRVLHLHGELTKVRSERDPALARELEGWELVPGTTGEDGAPLRPHIVWFGEPVPMIEPAARITSTADIVVVIGTSLAVYPAAGLLYHAPASARVFVIDPRVPPGVRHDPRVECIETGASEGVAILARRLGFPLSSIH
jgi:NAD-dependent deacetylase